MGVRSCFIGRRGRGGGTRELKVGANQLEIGMVLVNVGRRFFMWHLAGSVANFGIFQKKTRESAT